MGGLQKFLPPWSRRPSKTSASSTESKPAQPRHSSDSEKPSSKTASSQTSVASDKGVIVDFEQSTKPRKGKAAIRNHPLAHQGTITELSPLNLHPNLFSTGWPSTAPRTTAHYTLTPTSALLALHLYLHFTSRHAELLHSLTSSLFPSTHHPTPTHLATTLTTLHTSTTHLHTTLTTYPLPISTPLLNLIEDALTLRLHTVSTDTHALICAMQIARLDRSKRRPSMSDWEERMQQLAEYARQGASLIGTARVRLQREMERALSSGLSAAQGTASQTRNRFHSCQMSQDCHAEGGSASFEGPSDHPEGAFGENRLAIEEAISAASK